MKSPIDPRHLIHPNFHGRPISNHRGLAHDVDLWNATTGDGGETPGVGFEGGLGIDEVFLDQKSIDGKVSCTFWENQIGIIEEWKG